MNNSERLAELKGKAAYHKGQVRTHRRLLRVAMAEVRDFEARLAEMGIELVIGNGGGENHGRDIARPEDAHSPGQNKD